PQYSTITILYLIPTAPTNTVPSLGTSPRPETNHPRPARLGSGDTWLPSAISQTENPLQHGSFSTCKGNQHRKSGFANLRRFRWSQTRPKRQPTPPELD